MKFEVHQSDKNKNWFWHLRADNSEIVADCAEGYVDRDDCLHGLFLVENAFRDLKMMQTAESPDPFSGENDITAEARSSTFMRRLKLGSQASGGGFVGNP